MVWIFEGSEQVVIPPSKPYGFVYEIENLVSGRKYIGKKFLWSKKIRIIKGKKKRSLVESDWKKYHGSNGKLLEDIDKLGISNFRKTILRFCYNKSECAYWELKYQISADALLSEDYYNEWIMVKIRKANLRNATKINST